MHKKYSPKVYIVKGEDLHKRSDYKIISSSTNEKGKLHQFGCLYSVMTYPKEYPATTLALVKIHRKPVAIVSITHNPNKRRLLSDACYLDPSVEIKFPNFEIMAYTSIEHRQRGYAKQALHKILKEYQVQKDDNIYVYSETMENALIKMGYNAKNLHKNTI